VKLTLPVACDRLHERRFEGGARSPASNPDLQKALLEGLRDLGYVEGQNLAIEYRFILARHRARPPLVQSIDQASISKFRVRLAEFPEYAHQGAADCRIEPVFWRGGLQIRCSAFSPTRGGSSGAVLQAMIYLI